MTCPTPTKRRYATVEAAVREALREELAVRCLLAPYACPCGWVHLTSQPQVPDRIEPDPAIVNALRHVSHDEFVDVVEADTVGQLEMPARIALRSPRLHGRWVTALRAIAARLDRQLAEPDAAADWTRRASAFRHNVGQRLAEAEARRYRARCAS